MLLQFLVAVLLIEVTPGPNLGYLAALSASQGRRASLFATAGVAAGLATHAVAAALGVAALIAAHPVVYELLRWGGVAFLVWLAYEGWVGERDTSPAEASAVAGGSGLFWRGYWTNVLNPKSALFFITVVPRFLDGEHPGTAQLAGLVVKV
jgi:threonine/homoserine/homoserine lactone efflux protein